MKAKKTIFYLLMFLPLVMVLIALQFLPDIIPLHYDFKGQIDRWGSKYEMFIFPALTVIFGIFLIIVTKVVARQEKQGENNESICVIIGIASLFLFNVLTGYFLYISFRAIENLSEVAVDINQITCGILGLSIIVIGNIMPKARLNSILGLRTSWSMKNEWTWKKSQRFGGILLIIAGILIFVASCLTKGMACILWMLGILIVATIISVYYTYKIAKNENAA